MTPSSPTRRSSDLLALARLLLHLLTNGQCGFHRDELAVLDDSRHLAWGYVAYPPVVPFLAHASMALFGDSLAAYRAPSALAQALATLLARSEEHTSELQSLMRISYAVFCLK